MAGDISFPASWTDLCNHALGRLGHQLISNIVTDQTPHAAYCRLYLGAVIEEILGQFDWNGASRRIQLAESAESPVFGFAHAYQLPADFLRLVSAETDAEPYKVEGDRLLTDAEEVYLVYVFRPSEPNQLPHYLKKAIISGLAYRLTTPLSSNEQLKMEIKQEYLDPTLGSLEEARRTDARHSDPETVAEQNGYDWYDQLR